MLLVEIEEEGSMAACQREFRKHSALYVVLPRLAEEH